MPSISEVIDASGSSGRTSSGLDTFQLSASSMIHRIISTDSTGYLRRRGGASRAKARQAKARVRVRVRLRRKARQGKARQGKARQGKARQGKARQDQARQGQGKAKRKATAKAQRALLVRDRHSGAFVWRRMAFVLQSVCRGYRRRYEQIVPTRLNERSVRGGVRFPGKKGQHDEETLVGAPFNLNNMQKKITLGHTRERQPYPYLDTKKQDGCCLPVYRCRWQISAQKPRPNLRSHDSIRQQQVTVHRLLQQH